jgi:peptidoglycan/LPS O-acetylase OafA/YrhL
MSSVALPKTPARWPEDGQRKPHRLTCLTGVRFVAAMAVVLFHFGVVPLPGTTVWGVGQAVGFFFILSGIVLTYAYHDAITTRTISRWNFMNRRLARIFPVHVLTWVIATVLHVWFGWISSTEAHPIVSWVAGLFCLQVYWPSPGFIGRWNPPAWSISCELFFYALFPFVLPLMVRLLKSARSIIVAMICIYLGQVVVSIVLSGVVDEIFRSGHAILGYHSATELENTAMLAFPPLRLSEFLIGVCIGLLILRREPQSLVQGPIKTNLLLAVSVFALVLVMGVAPAGPVEAGLQKYLLIPAFVLLLIALVAGGTVVAPLLENRLAIILGEASYSLYLIHSFFTPDPGSGRLQVILRITASVVCSVILYRWFEQPARRIWRRAFSGR